MATLDTINKSYMTCLTQREALLKCKDSITKESDSNGVSQTEAFLRIMGHIDLMYRSVKCSDFPFLADAVTIGILYRNCISSVSNYEKQALINISGDSNNTESSLVQCASLVMKARRNYEETRQRFAKKYEYPIDSTKSIISFIKYSLDDALRLAEDKLSTCRKAAADIVNGQFPLQLKLTDALQNVTELPDQMTIGRYYDGTMPYQVLNDLGIKRMFHNVSIDIRHGGNVLITTEYEHLNDEAIEAFVLSYTFRYLEQFPLGAVNVHLIDKNAKYIIRRFYNGFQNEAYADGVKRVVQLHSEMSALKAMNDIVCEDIIRKTSVNRPDLFSIYEEDQSDAFNLVVLKDGLVEMNGAASTEALEIISSLIKENDVGHKSGIRFLIVDNSSSVEKTLNPAIKLLLKSIRENCQICIDYKNGAFHIGNQTLETLSITGNVETFVEERSRAIAEAISKKERTYISLKEVNAATVVESVGSIMTIPVGKAGQEIIELPFSCRDENGTVAGQCIGYMAIGQSGSGKSSFFHSVVLNGCLRYSPKDLQFWLLDFKFGGASSKYSSSGIPHIRIIAENNKVDDALCLFQMVSEEMDRRNRAFNKQFVDNIVDYNRIAAQSGSLEYFPRIIIAIDEIQEIFRDDNAALIQKQIAAISVRMRSAGMHFVMVAQNLSDGKSYMLKEAFLPSASGRICFRVAQNIPRDSGFEDDFIQRKEEIAELKTGEAYISYGKGTIRKVKIAYASAEDMIDQYFQQIKDQYPEFTGMAPLVIGSKKRLSITDRLQRRKISYAQAISELSPDSGAYHSIIAEDSYRMSPMQIQFSQYEDSTLWVLGNDKKIASSICAVTAASLIHQNATIHLFNGDRTLIQEGGASSAHPFMYLCQHVTANNSSNAKVYRLNQFAEVLRDLYAEFLKRQKQDQDADDFMPDFSAIFLLVNDLFGIESFVSNHMVESEEASDQTAPSANRFDFLAARSKAQNNSSYFKESVQNIIATLIQSGYRYNIHMILSVRGEPSVWRNSRLVSDAGHVILFNPTQFVDQMENTYYLREMLKNISNENNEETMAVSSIKHSYSKIRPIMIDVADKNECLALDALLGGKMA